MEASANLESFLQWGAALGISDSPISHSNPSHSCLGYSLSVSHFPEAGGRGLAATRVLRKGELVLRVPKEALMTSDCPIGNDQKLSLAKYPLLSSTQIFSIALLNEVNKGRSSWWYPYLKQLPRSYYLLASFSQFEIEALQIDDAIWTAEKAVLKSKTEWEEATPLMSEVNLKLQLRTFNAWLWAFATVLLSYGTYTDLELLEHYGFILEENPNDKAFVSLETEMYSLCSWPKDSLYISQDGKPSFALLSTVRLWATSLNKRRSVKDIAFTGQHISNENEVAVMEWVAKKCLTLLSSCSTSIDEDALLLNIIDKIQDYTGEAEGLPVSCDEVRTFLESNCAMSGKNTFKFEFTAKTRWSVCRWKLAVQWRYKYKKILSDCVSYCTKVLDSLC